MSQRIDPKGSADEASGSELKKRPPMNVTPYARQQMQACSDFHDEYRRHDLGGRQKEGQRCDREQREAEAAVASYHGGAENTDDGIEEDQ